MIFDSFLNRLHELESSGLLPGEREPLCVTGCPGAGPALLAAALLQRGSPVVVLVVDSPSLAEAALTDLTTGAETGDARLLPQRETLPFEDSDPHVEITSQRAEAFSALLSGKTRLVVTTARGLVERSPVAVQGTEFAITLREGDSWSRTGMADRLRRMGFESSESVRELGDFAVRGGIVDVFPFGVDRPFRVELWDDAIASIRTFDLLSQRSVERHVAAEILPASLSPELFEASEAKWERRCLLELLPDGAIVVESGGAASSKKRERLWEEVCEAWGNDAPGGRRSAEDLVIPPAAAERKFDTLTRVRVEPTDSRPLPGERTVDLGLALPPAIDRNMEHLVAAVQETRDRGEQTLILCDNQGQLERLEEILEELAGRTILRSARLALGSLSGGFRIPGPRPLLVLTDHEIFQRSHRPRRGRNLHGVASLESIATLSPGDYVVHMDHGIGRYSGLERVTVGDETIETLKLEYADGEVLRLPHYRIDLIEKWTGLADGDDPVKPPPVHKLGGKRWKQLRTKTEAEIRAMATELLELYAHRQVSDGHAFPADTRWQRELESAFLYEDTPDQRKAWDDVRGDMMSAAIMDRLICGDVGYGKTEIAIRAAFKAVQDGRQVAVLAPTTILVEQHLHTFRERLAGFPVTIEALSRLRTAAEQTQVLERLKSGRIDILVGTHRLLSPDVEFRNLGLLVVDEEQRFGVKHKERLKDLKRSVDVLTLTATPIPRTLQLALGGMRDMSLIETAPRDRMPVITHVMPWSDGILQDAIRRELERAGQIFVVHDRIETIGAIAQRVQQLVPDARIAVAHGRMPERELEQVMDRLLDRRIDVLVSTSIIENGLDVPTANTMIVHRSDQFGLAQLYQLRGRVGRSHHRAYCYLILPPSATQDAIQRLRILEHHTELGSGYRVALKDLQLRGAGNLLGGDQSGFAHAVGFDTYQRLLRRAVQRLRGEAVDEKRPPAQVSVEGEALLPDEYIAGSDQKLHLYRRLARAERLLDIDALRAELEDRFGPVPTAADRWLDAARLKLLAGELDIEWVGVSDRTARLNFRPGAVPRLARLSQAFGDKQITVEVRRTQPLSLLLIRAGVEPLPPTLVEALELLATDPVA